jgi:hypothetical protein
MRLLLITALMASGSWMPVAAQLPDAPSASRPIPKYEQAGWYALSAADIAATVADAAVTSHAHLAPVPGGCHESNPIFGGLYPSSRRLWLQMAATTAGVTAATWWLKRKRHRWWSLLSVADAGGHAAGAAYTARECW